MASKQSPAKVTLGMMKGKPITTSVPVIKYHASDDELEELYPSTDEEKPKTPESEKTSPKSSPFKIPKLKSDNNESNDELGEQRSSSLDLSEGGTPPSNSDPWKVLSDIRGKITKTFEDKLSEIKSEKKNKHRSRENSSVSDPEDLGNITPTEDVSEKLDKPDKELSPSKSSKKSHSRFRFSSIKTGLKAKNKGRDESIESGVEAAELVEVDSMSFSNTSKGQETSEISSVCTVQNLAYSRLVTDVPVECRREFPKPGKIITELKSYILSRIFLLLVFLGLISYLVPLVALFTGMFAGSVVAVTVQKMLKRVGEVVAMPVEVEEPSSFTTVPVVEVPAAEEYAVVDKFEGWLNELPYNYEPDNYHVARTQSVYFKLEGDSLKVIETRTRIPKRAVWNEPQPTAKFTRKRVYSLVGAKVELLPEGLTRRRRWSKKYPICVTLGREGVVENIALETPSDDELQTELEKDKLIVEEDETDDDLSFSKDTKDVFEDCQDDVEDLRSKLFFFGRTDRQKEDWYRRLVLATTSCNKRNSIPSGKELTSSSSNLSLSQTSGDTKNSTTTPVSVDIPAELSFNSYMSRYADTSTPTESNGSLAESEVLWLNALLGRIIFDMHKSPDMINVLQDKIQRKLSNIKLPYFMESLMISELVIGQGAPFIHKASKPVVDERGLWIDLNITYECGLTMTVETKLNLMKLTRAGSVINNSNDSNNGNDSPKPAKSPMFDSDVEDSPETSTEDEESINMPTSTRESTPSQSSGRKFLSMVDKLAANKYFQHAAELTYVRRAMEGVSNTEIRLMVSVSSIEGCLSVNIPPPPSDRLWYGFKPIPKINLDARPAVGERAVNIGYVTNWIKTKLLKEFDKIVVLPNMDDIVIPLCPNYPYHTS
ncbi:testis-expressed protein 2 [Microplitis demolitor]|uniref:testis-expressed protein 2 n=1 Tax=Microplitis demolitor TaxID=69319 RepID=UPI0004CD7295|nr:testis-expressed protein 2 [Microplitis demolitor]XP_008560813.1 testis-expressed protein 2 [Microplitis demolitor]XP_008560815.1 testis-expressed protein 2 [Microplitis demolitor]XP_053593673.1 testis-expressed protein 2 [Microplitis demolitor]XP_053593674.1 testis-expressed protein 2 [Microplitis demolitor]